MTVNVTIKNIYGQDKIYPACEKSKVFAELAGTTTLTPASIALIKKLGYEVIVISVLPSSL